MRLSIRKGNSQGKEWGRGRWGEDLVPISVSLLEILSLSLFSLSFSLFLNVNFFLFPLLAPSLSLLLYLFWCLTKAKLAQATTTNPAANPAPIPSWPHAVAPSPIE